MYMTIKRNYEVKGISCVNCAGKIEAGIKELDGVNDASINFPLSKLSIEISDTSALTQIENRIQEVLDGIEADSKLVIKDDDQVDHDDNYGMSKMTLFIYIVAAVSYFAGFFLVKDSAIKLILFVLTYIVFGHKVLIKSVKNISKGNVFDENFLMSIASIGAFIIGEYPEAAAVMMFYQIGELFQNYAVDHSKRAIKSLIAIKPDYANIKTPEGYEKVNPSNVKIGDLIVIRPGERVPLDGIVVEGSSALDTSALTGESLPREVGTGGEILSGSINLSGVLTVQVTKLFESSTVNRILSMVEDASQKKAVTERFITRFAAVYTPAVVGLAALLAVVPPLFFNGEFSQWIYRALVFLVVSCPCALVISIPLGFFGGIGAASKRGILVKGGNYLEALAKVNTMVFDKTGTLTSGTFEVTEINNKNGFTKDQVLYYAAHAEAFSTHPLATSVLRKYGDKPDKNLVTEYVEHAGMGISAKVSEKAVLLGNRTLFSKHNIEIKDAKSSGTLIYLAIDGLFAGSVALEDTVKEDGAKAIKELRSLGISDIVMLTGDRKDAADVTAEKLGINTVFSELLPHEKVDALEKIISEHKNSGKIAFVGDGINDSPVIARADIGIAMGGTGSDAAIEAADIVMMTDEPGKIPEAVRIARKTKTVVYQNIALAMIVKVIVLALGAGGVASLWEAVFADVGVALLAILNAMRLTR
ncbi:MAG TPA: cadmium-translocating P-type ATPase, partial [Clostridiaceae bacterium]|nr:cadmium-translocating P-type ATPase [Clostridiaceae bacterium]